MVLLNIFVAILCDSYNEVKFSDDEEDEDQGEAKKSYDRKFLKILEGYVTGFVWKIKVAFFAYFNLADDLENYYKKKLAKEDDPIKKDNFLFDYGMLIDWSLESDEDLENVSRFNGDELWDFISNCGERLSKFVNNIIIGYIHIILCFILLCLSLLIDVL